MDRRAFIQGSLLAVSTFVAGTATRTEAASKFPTGLVYTQDNPGRWANVVILHTPIVTMDAGRIKIVTPHPMTEKHYIVKHVLLTEDGLVLGEKTFAHTDADAESHYGMIEGFHANLWATSFCNIHDLWLVELKI